MQFLSKIRNFIFNNQYIKVLISIYVIKICIKSSKMILQMFFFYKNKLYIILIDLVVNLELIVTAEYESHWFVQSYKY